MTVEVSSDPTPSVDVVASRDAVAVTAPAETLQVTQMVREVVQVTTVPTVLQTSEVGVQGLAGPAGATGPAGPQNLVVGPTNPLLKAPGVWVQTFANGDIAFWVEDGS